MRIFTCLGFMIIAMLNNSCAQSAAVVPSNASANSQSANNSEDEFAVNGKPLKLPLSRPKIVVIKSQRRLMLYSGDELVR